MSAQVSAEMNETTRMKYWKELDADEKVERMREQVKRLEMRIENMGRLIDKLTSHRHGEDGQLHVLFNPFESGYGGSPSRLLPSVPREDDEVYF